ncbi:MAG: AmmeMemoRadiSam system protein B [Desulfuromonadaceae bacterium]|nr:AmmeMemoRadiSam system protein B [Desulfuromonadaceae bacterium]MDD5105779.1 AmmeMemoRadiSam system protein B [Desulfuromonadaceae bacterium]
MQRQPAVAGQFYPDSESQLRAALSQMIPERSAPQATKGIISPHAGYLYSGAIAGQLFAKVTLPKSVLIIGPNHHGVGAAAALYPDGEWLTPLGTTPIDSRLNTLLLEHGPYLHSDTVAHQHEHSLEVQLPFLQHLRPDVIIAALCIGQGNYEVLRDIGHGIAAAIKEYGEEVLIVASSDMTHYESADAARRKDHLALECISALDGRGLLETCRRQQITMCGVAPATVMLEAVLQQGATHAEIVAYNTSGDITGDNRQVVGYAAVLVR